MNLFDNQQCMAITFINVSKFKSLTEKGNLEVRPIGGRILLPGTRSVIILNLTTLIFRS